MIFIIDFLLNAMQLAYIVLFWIAMLIVQIVWFPVALFIVAPWQIISRLLKKEEEE